MHCALYFRALMFDVSVASCAGKTKGTMDTTFSHEMYTLGIDSCPKAQQGPRGCLEHLDRSRKIPLSPLWLGFTLYFLSYGQSGSPGTQEECRKQQWKWFTRSLEIFFFLIKRSLEIAQWECMFKGHDGDVKSLVTDFHILPVILLCNNYLTAYFPAKEKYVFRC